MERGQMFGEIAMTVKNSKRTAGIKCASDCIFGAISS